MSVWSQAKYSALALCLCACAARQGESASPAASSQALSVLDHAHFRWVSAQCVDGVLDLARQGFERTLTTEVYGSKLRFTYDTQLAQPACISTEVWSLQPAAAGQWEFTADAEVRLPADTPCGASTINTRPADARGQGIVQLSGDTLEELRFGSPWCRGFDVRFVYQRIPSPPLDRDEIVRRYIAHWNRRDARAVASLFADQGALVEPFSRSNDGLPVRHEGRAQIEAWLAQAFNSVPWFALQLTDIQAFDDAANQAPRDAGQSLALWRYFDPGLAEPLYGRNLFVLAGGEIFATELQLVSEPVPSSSLQPNTP
jgi:hypothetical protein